MHIGNSSQSQLSQSLLSRHFSARKLVCGDGSVEAGEEAVAFKSAIKLMLHSSSRRLTCEAVLVRLRWSILPF